MAAGKGGPSVVNALDGRGRAGRARSHAALALPDVELASMPVTRLLVICVARHTHARVRGRSSDVASSMTSRGDAQAEAAGSIATLSGITEGRVLLDDATFRGSAVHRL